MPRLQKFFFGAALAALMLALLWWVGPRGPLQSQAPAVMSHYADIAHAVYDDAHVAALQLQTAIDDFVENPDAASLRKAREAWVAARVPYMQSEVFRFGNPIVDEWEGQVNAWPLDEGLIDYVSTEYVHEGGNVAANANIVSHVSESPLLLGGEQLDVSSIDAELLANLNEFGGSEANVATGYHAIEFLLWGQDLNQYKAGAGERPSSDYVADEAQCSNGAAMAADAAVCSRRADYLRAAIGKLVADLAWMRDQWSEQGEDHYRAEFLDLSPEEALRRIFLGMGSLALGELAGERMKVALIANSPEDEHDCFSDNTHWSHYYNLQGISNVYQGQYQRVDGEVMDGPGVATLLRPQHDSAADDIRGSLALARQHMQALADRAENGMRFDQMIEPGNKEGAMLIRQAIQALASFAAELEGGARALGLHDIEADDAGHSF